MVDERIEAASNVLARTLQTNPLSREAWLQFIFEGDATKYPPNFSASSDGTLGIGASSLGGRLSMDGVPHIEFRCDAETFVQVVNGLLPLEDALSSGRLSVQGGEDIMGGKPAGGQADAVRESLVKELGSRLAAGASHG